MKQAWNDALTSSLEFFERSTNCLEAKDAGFKPTDEAMTVAQQIAHVAYTVDWFVDGAFSPEGFNMDFESHMADLAKVETLEDAQKMLRDAYGRARARVESASQEEWETLLPEGPVMGGCPRFTIIHGIVEHTAHHRGALTVYSRLCQHTPVMPYM